MGGWYFPLYFAGRALDAHIGQVLYQPAIAFGQHFLYVNTAIAGPDFLAKFTGAGRGLTPVLSATERSAPVLCSCRLTACEAVVVEFFDHAFCDRPRCPDTMQERDWSQTDSYKWHAPKCTSK